MTPLSVFRAFELKMHRHSILWRNGLAWEPHVSPYPNSMFDDADVANWATVAKAEADSAIAMQT